MGKGGAERVLADTINHINKEKYIVHLALISTQDDGTLSLLPKDLKVISLWNNYPLSYKIAFRFSIWLGINFLLKRHINAVLDKDYDIEISFLEGMPLKLHYLRETKAKRINWVHIDINSYRYASYAFYNEKEERLAYYSMDKIVCVSLDTKRTFLLRYPELSKKVSVIYNSIDPYDIMNKANDFKVKRHKFTVITVCRLDAQKSLDRLIRVAKKTKDAHMDICFQIIGEGKEASKLKRLTIDNNVIDRVFFMGYKPNPYPYIKAADMMLSTSQAEGFGLSICEAMCLHTPVVSTKTAGPIEIIDNNQNGILCEHDDASIFNALCMIYKDPILRNNISERAFKKISCFKVDKINKQIELLLDNI